MAGKQYPIINNFSKGELSARMEGRVDIQGYYNGCKTMKNCIMVAQGGAEKRPGFIHLAEVKESDENIRLIPFEVSDTELYMLEFGYNYIRVWNTITKKLIPDPDLSGLGYIKTEYNDSDLAEIQKAQTEGKIFFAHNKYPVKQLSVIDGVFYFTGTSITVNSYESGGDYKAGQVVLFEDKYFRAKKDITSSATDPEAGKWEARGQIPHTATADIIAWTSTSYSEGDLVTNDEKIWACLVANTGQEPGVPPTNKVYKWRRGQTHKINIFSNILKIGLVTLNDMFIEYYNGLYGENKWKVTNTYTEWFDSVYEVEYLSYETDTTNYWTNLGINLSNINSPYTVVKAPKVTGGSYAQDDYVFNEDTFEVFKSLENTNTSDLAESILWENFIGNPMCNADGDYPSAVTFMSDRLYLGGTKNNPQTVYASKIGNHLNFSMGLDDDDAYAFTIASDRSSRIKWLMAKDNLMIGTSSSEWLASGLTPTSIQVLRQSVYGSAYSQAVFVADSLLFFQKGGRKLREYIYSNDNKTYLANDITFFADHITEGGLVDSVYQQNPDSILWSIKEDGALIGLTYDRLNGIAGWHRHNTDGLFKSIASIDSNTDEDELWVVVSRYVDGDIKQYIEYMASRNFDSQETAIYSDSAITVNHGDKFMITGQTWSATKVTISYYGTANFTNGDYVKIFATGVDTLDGYIFEVANINTGAGTFDLKYQGETYIPESFTDTEVGTVMMVKDVITGLSHLEGVEVSILGDGGVYPAQTVSGGQITLSSKCNNVVVGRKYEMELEPESIELQGTMGSTKRISKATLRLYKTLGGWVGSDRSNLEELSFRDTSTPFGTPSSLYTGIKTIPVDAPSEKEASIYIYHDQPLPMTVLAIVTDISYSRS